MQARVMARVCARCCLSLVVLALTIAGGCDEHTTKIIVPGVDVEGSFSGCVYSHPSGRRIPGAECTFLSTSTAVTSGFDGTFSVDGLTAGSHELLVTAPGHVSMRVGFTLEPGDPPVTRIHEHRDIHLIARDASLRLAVFTYEGDPAAQALVELYDWGIPANAHYQAIEDLTVPALAQTDSAGICHLTGLPATSLTVAVREFDADGDGAAEHRRETDRVELRSEELVEASLTLKLATESVHLLDSSIPSASWPLLRNVAAEFGFSAEMDTSAQATVVDLRQAYDPGPVIPVASRWISPIRLEIHPDTFLVDEDQRYELSFALRSSRGAGLQKTWDLRWVWEDPGSDSSGCWQTVSDLRLSVNSPTPDYNTRQVVLAWSPVSCPGGYNIFARDDWSNPAWVFLQHEPSDFEYGTIQSICTLPENFDRYRGDTLVTPLARTAVTFCVLPAAAPDGTPGDPHPELLFTDRTPPRILEIVQCGPGHDFDDVPTPLDIRVHFSEYADPECSVPVLEILEAGGDPSWALDAANAVWEWDGGFHGGVFHFMLEPGQNASGDRLRVVATGLTDLSSNVASEGTCSDWLTILAWPDVFDFENSPQGWTAEGAGWYWGIPQNEVGSAHSGQRCWGTTLVGDYGNGWDAILSSPLLHVGTAGSELRYWRWFDTEMYGDYCFLEIEHEAGVDRRGIYHGAHRYWSQAVYPLSSYGGQQIRIRFRFQSDAEQTDAGFFLDDVEITGATAVSED